MTEIRTHGYGSYSRGCRCETCRAAKAAYMAARRAAARALARRFSDALGRHLATGITHGTRFGYEEAGCRCRPCMRARGAAHLATVRRRRSRTTQVQESA